MAQRNYGDMTPPEVASEVLKDHHGNQRNAEVKAWEQCYRYKQDQPGYAFWVAVVKHIVERTEVPSVARVDHMRSAEGRVTLAEVA